MSRGKVNKQVYCKRAVFLQNKDRPQLQAKLSEALAKLRQVGARKEASGDEGRYVRALIYHREYAGMLFGILASYERGTSQLMVVDEDEVEMLTVDQVAPPQNTQQQRQEFLEGVCYFGVYKNHVVVVTSRPLGTKQTEHHINWLLTTAHVLAPESNAVVLSDHVSHEMRQKIEQQHVKQVEIGALLLHQPATSAEFLAGPGEVQTATQTSFLCGGLAVNILRQMLGSHWSDLNLVDALEGNIEVSLKVRYKRKTTAKGHQLMDKLAMQLRHLDEDDVKVSLVGGGTIKGQELKLSAPLTIEACDGIPNQDHLFEKMRSWLLALLKNGVIEP